MTTFLFSRLSKQAQDAACARYEGEQIVQEAANDMIDNDVTISIPDLFDGLGWRFDKEGVRVSM